MLPQWSPAMLEDRQRLHVGQEQGVPWQQNPVHGENSDLMVLFLGKLLPRGDLKIADLLIFWVPIAVLFDSC